MNASSATVLSLSQEDWPELRDGALHGLAGQVVSTLRPHTEADSVGLLLTFLAYFGAMVPQPHAIADGARHPARIYPLLVGNTSRGRKGTSMANVSRIIEEADPYFASERVFSGLASGEGLIAALSESEVTDKRTLVFEPEFARILQVCSRDGSTLSPILRDAWDRESLRVITRKDPLRVDGAHVVVVGHITRAELQRYLSATDIAGGLGNRFSVALVRRAQRLPRGGSLSMEAVGALAKRVAEAASRASRLGLIVRDPDAEILWADIYESIDDEADGLFGAMTARAEAQMLRFQVIYAALDGTETINVAHVEASKALWDYCEESLSLIFGEASGDVVKDRLLDGLRQAGEQGLSLGEQFDLFGRHVTRRDLELARAELEKAGLIVTERHQTSGRPKTVSRVVDRGKAAAESDGPPLRYVNER